MATVDRRLLVRAIRCFYCRATQIRAKLVIIVVGESSEKCPDHRKRIAIALALGVVGLHVVQLNAPDIQAP